MMPLNSFLEQHQGQMWVFLDKASEVAGLVPDTVKKLDTKSQLRDLAVIVRYLDLSLGGMEKKLEEDPRMGSVEPQVKQLNMERFKQLKRILQEI